MKRLPGKKWGPKLFLVGKIWHFRFQVNGHRQQSSTGTWDKGRAEQIAFREYHAQETIPSLAELAQQWLEAHELTVSAAHRKNIEVFARLHIYDCFSSTRIDQVETGTVEHYRNKYLKAGHSQNSANKWLRTLRLLYGWAVSRKLIDSIPWKLGPIRTQRKPRALLPVDKSHEWLAAVERIAGKRWGLLTAIELMVALGLRESEALSARWEWIDWERKTYCPGRTKTGESDPRTVPEWLLTHLKPRRKDLGLIAPSPRGGTYAAGATRILILQANKEVGTPGVTAHRLRGNYATLLSENGVPLQTIQRALGHQDPLTTVGYLERRPGYLERIAAAQEAIAEKVGYNRPRPPRLVVPPAPRTRKRRKNGEGGPADGRE